MSLSATRLGANAPGLPGPAPLPPIAAALSRRAALFGAVTVAGVTMSACSPAKGHAAGLSPDADLIARAGALHALKAREQRAWDGLTDDDPDEGPAHHAATALTADVVRASKDLAEVSAITAAGVAAKASAMLALVGDDWFEFPCACEEHDRLVVSILRDAARLGAGALS